MQDRELKLKDFKKILKDNGFRFSENAKGSHEKWKNENNVVFVLPIKPVVQAGIIWQFKRLLKTL